ncbi:sulfatase [Flammeovirga sp. EKP202]|uniref:sulfatase family protein n=1 Tax=Flammeovirga sp. EKP202 TaxID=2770592 RepID=UPI00165F9BAB|nr:sulfatase-like hydrolase/transferase [Flammeovirga sp. EKP202]MBD0400608.1 sulfatase-like hydrolase/transferase [Flammeovirga sp. EKP202]
MRRNRLLYLTVLLITLGNVAMAQKKEQKTNFIQILTDDQGWGDLASFGHQFIKSPNIDKLGEEGVKLTNCYAADGVCSPSRSSILTGRTPYRNGVYRWVPASHFCYLRKSEITLPQLMRKEGFSTAHFGKWHLNGFQEERVGKTEIYKNFKWGVKGQPSMEEYGYDYWFATPNVARPNHKDPENFFLNGELLGKIEGYSAQIVAKQFVDWFLHKRDKSKPFFITIWFHEPHGPINSNPEFVKLYDKLKDPSMQQFLANVTQIDDAVGTIVNALKQEGVFDDTFIWYTSDNGPEGIHEYGTFNQDDHVYGNSRYRGDTGGLKGRKRWTHEGGIRVPGIISWPNGLAKYGYPEGKLSAEPVIGSDIFPTFLEVAGIDLPKGVIYDGVSAIPLLKEKKIKRERPLYWRNNTQEYRVAIRVDNWKLLCDAKRTKFVLYDLEKDIRETTDLSAYYPKVVERMKKQLIALDNEVLTEGPDWWKGDKFLKGQLPDDKELNTK